MYKSLLILFLLPIFMKHNNTSHKLLYKCLAHDVMHSARQFSHSYLSYRCKCIVLSTVSEDLLVLLTPYFVRDKAGERLDIRFPFSSWSFIFARLYHFFVVLGKNCIYLGYISFIFILSCNNNFT
jgi:hypothetical protein